MGGAFANILHLSSSIQVVNQTRVVDALSRINLIQHEFQINTLGFDGLQEMYKEDADFKEAYATYENPVSTDRTPWLNYMI
jgi:hypothetical protein